MLQKILIYCIGKPKSILKNQSFSIMFWDKSVEFNIKKLKKNVPEHALGN